MTVRLRPAAPTSAATLSPEAIATGERLVAVADELVSTGGAAVRSADVLAALLEGAHLDGALAVLTELRPTASDLFNAFVYARAGTSGHEGLHAALAQRFTPVALPGEPLRAPDLLAGDLVVRVARGEHWGQLGVVVEPLLHAASEAGGRRAGGYLALREWSPRALSQDAPVLRRVADERGLLLPDTLVLRVRSAPSSDSAVAPGLLVPGEYDAYAETPSAVVHPTIRRGSRGAVVREAQTRLNTVHARNLAQGIPGLRSAPLAVDGVFGQLTQNAVISFQQQAFPNEPREWDGIIGPKTWEKLHAASSGSTPVVPVPVPPVPVPVPPVPVPPVPVPPVPATTVDRRLTRAEVLRWFPTGMDTQGQPLGRITSNNRVIHLIRGRATFDAMLRAMRTATGPGHFIYLMGWWLTDSFVFAGGTTIGQVFTNASRAGVAVRALLWDQFGRQNSAEVDNINAMPNGAAILDNRTLIFGSHHQKVLIVNGREGLYAFCGGIDLNPDRINTVTTGTFSSGGAGSPLHDVHCQIQGPAAFDLLQIFHQRWNDHPDHGALDRRKGAPPTVPSPGPISGAREWVQIGRTFGNGNNHRGIDSDNFGTRPRGYTFLRGRNGEQTVKRMVLHAIAQARRFIYMEEQYLVSLEIRDALIRALPNIAHLTILIPDGSISDLPQGNFRRREFIRPLKAAGGGKVRVFHPFPPRAPFGYVHAKMWVFDDEYAIIGSANCNRRGYTHDSEVIAGIVDEGSGEDMWMPHRLRVDLWSLHLNVPPRDVIDGVASAGLWLRPVGAGRVEPHDENAGIERVHTDTSWNNVVDPDGS
jgi:phosphatidylserine/phosphatidylglycerophosphate/cardiolipin synthase-like enzyme